MADSIKNLLNGYIVELQNIYDTHMQSVILYGSYAGVICHMMDDFWSKVRHYE